MLFYFGVILYVFCYIILYIVLWLYNNYFKLGCHDTIYYIMYINIIYYIMYII